MFAALWGYESQASFTRAYGKMHSHPPGKTRETGANITAYPPLHFTLTVKGEHPMNYEINRKPQYRLIGTQWTVSTRDGENSRVIPGYWNQIMKDGTFTRMAKQAEPHGVFSGSCVGLALDFDDAKEQFTYMIGIERDTQEPAPGWVALTIESMTYAVFKDQGSPLSKAIKKTFTRIFQEWFPSTGHEHADGPEVEVYHHRDSYEVWIPVVTR